MIISQSVRDRFWPKVEKRSEEECWEWAAGRNSHGYGMSVEGRNMSAHRLSYLIHIGDIPQGMVIDHLCRTRHCVNPAHMEIVTNAENTLRGNGVTARFARQTHCKHGHEFTPENTMIRRRPSGGRRCRICDNTSALDGNEAT